jgi:hypothetical protein
MRVRFNIFHCKWQSCHWVLYLPSPVFQTETTRPMCNRVLIYIFRRSIATLFRFRHCVSCCCCCCCCCRLSPIDWKWKRALKEWATTKPCGWNEVNIYIFRSV